MLIARTRRIAGWVILAFVVYAVVKSPTQAADIVHTSFDILAKAVRSIFTFFDALMS